jgi:FixJ family two-component response regulator
VLVAAGTLEKRIAAELQLSKRTVKVRRAQVMRKMQAKSLLDLVRFADRLTMAIPKRYTTETTAQWQPPL